MPKSGRIPGCYQFFLIILFLYGLISPALAQSNSDSLSNVKVKSEERNHAFGVRAGLSYSKFVGETIDMSNFRTGLVLGAFYTRGIGKHLYFQPEMLYVKKGHKINEFDTEIKLAYIDMPLLVKYYIPTISSLKPCYFMGPAVSLLLSAKLKYPDGEMMDTKEFYNDIDFGMVFGGGMDFVHGENRIVTDLRFTLGVKDIVDDGSGYNDTDIRNASFNFTIGYQF